ncbi:MAG: PEP-CTERM sorting domain-containing protein [Planctomycetota bacterium]
MRGYAFVVALVIGASPLSLSAEQAIDTALSANYLIITTDGSSNDASDGLASVQISNFEIGANKAPVPSTDDFLSGGSSGGPTLLGAVPDIPASGVVAVGQGIGGNGNVAITNDADEFDASDVGVYADPAIGIQIAAPNDSFNKASNSFFNDPNSFPNTFMTTGPTGVLGNLGGIGSDVNPGAAVQSTRIDEDGSPGNVGVTFGFDHSALLAELAAARSTINGLASTGTLNVAGGNGGQFDTATSLSGPASISSSPTPATSEFSPSSDSRDFTISLAPGLNVIDFATGDNDILLNNSNLIVDGPAGSTVIFRFDDDNFLVSNSNILLGDGGIGLNNVLFYTDQDSNDTIFDFSNTILNGAAFWSLGDGGGSIGVDNGQGSTQFVADMVTLQDVRFTRWSFGVVPEPTGLVLLGLGSLGLALRRSR